MYKLSCHFLVCNTCVVVLPHETSNIVHLYSLLSSIKCSNIHILCVYCLVIDMTYNVFGGTLRLTQSINHCLVICSVLFGILVSSKICLKILSMHAWPHVSRCSIMRMKQSASCCQRHAITAVFPSALEDIIPLLTVLYSQSVSATDCVKCPAITLLSVT